MNLLGGFVKLLSDNKSLLSMVFSVGLMMNPLVAVADTPPDACSKELLISHFPQIFVTETLKKFDIPQDKWNNIIKELDEKSPEVMVIVEQKAAKMDPNPFKDRSAQQRQVAVKLFRETIFEKFNEVLKANGIDDEKKAQLMLDDIALQKAKNFAACIEKQKSDAAPAVTPEPAAVDHK